MKRILSFLGSKKEFDAYLKAIKQSAKFGKGEYFEDKTMKKNI